MAVRAAAHIAFAQRGSRLALYDLRETVAAANAPLPVDFLSALSAIGEASCLEPIADAYAHATSDARSDDVVAAQSRRRFSRHRRARATSRAGRAAVKRIEKKWPGLFECYRPAGRQIHLGIPVLACA